MTVYLLSILCTAALICTVTGLDSENIINGYEVTPDQQKLFRYHVFIKTDSKECSGALINEKFVLTAAQCVNDVKPNKGIVVYAGIIDSDEKVLRHANHQTVNNIYVPPEFQSRTVVKNGKKIELFLKDIAVLKLDGAFRNDSSEIRSARVPKSLRRYKIPAIVTDFGRAKTKVMKPKNTKEKSKTKNDIRKSKKKQSTNKKLKWAPVLQVNHDSPVQDVMESYSFSGKSRSNLRSPCVGNTGAPLVVDETVFGILSTFSGDCAESADNFAYYTEVSSYSDFIQKAMNNETEGF